MADDDQYNDEYQFADLDAINTETGDESQTSEQTPKETQGVRVGTGDNNNIKRNAIIVVALVIIAMVVYKIIEASSAHKKEVASVTVPAPVSVAPASVEQQPAVVPVAQAQLPVVDNNVSQKLSMLESSQQNMRSDVSSVHDQLGGISNNVNAIVTKMTELNAVIANLSAKVDEQSREIDALTIRHEEVKKAHHRALQTTHYPKYHIQAVIPGRAWLIAANGATLTVREGTIVAGYGMVRLIDPNQGRVTTSSGQVIRFSQEDS